MRAPGKVCCIIFARAAPPPDAMRIFRMKILLADDSMTIRRVVSNALSIMGCSEILQAECGEDALALLKQNPDVNLVMLDWNMPPMNGIECLKAIRADPAIKHIPVVMVTADAAKESIQEALNCGANNYLIKPFSPERLKETVEKILARKKAPS